MSQSTSTAANQQPNGASQLGPCDQHNQRLLASVRPDGWINPQPVRRYNLVVIGGGTAGLVAAAGAAGLGATVALVERQWLGGDCLNLGCVPSKALIRSARAMADVRDAQQLGVHVPPGSTVDFAAVMQRMRRLRAEISPHDSASRFRELGVDVYFGDACFTGRDSVAVGGQTLRFARACIATGARAAGLPVPGLKEVAYLTSETVFGLTQLPRRLAVLGAGPIGCELAQAFARFGSEVHLIESMHGVLPREDSDASEIVRQSMERDGVRLRCCATGMHVKRIDGGKQLTFQSHGNRDQLVVDEILVAAGRSPNVERLGLEAAGVAHDRTGVRVNAFLQTTNRRIYSAGDVCSAEKFTHAADAMARMVIQNALFFGYRRSTALTIPWCTYTDPELAHVGIYPHQAAAKGIAIDTFTIQLADVDRAVLDGQTTGFLKLHVRKGKDKILGATVVAPHAGGTISELTVAMAAGVGLRTLSGTIHPYPTHSEIIKKAADAYRRAQLTPPAKRLLRLLMRLRR